ncbi:MAG: hypothetical protein R2706_20305 [Acidimicrobiales bacterium]
MSHHIAFCGRHLDEGAQLLGAFDEDAIVGKALVEPSLRPGLGWLALLHVSNGRRRGGVDQAQWSVDVSVARKSGASAMHVSATPSESAVPFDLKQGCRLAASWSIERSSRSAAWDTTLCQVRALSVR